MRKRREYCKDKFSKMSMEEKIDFYLKNMQKKTCCKLVKRSYAPFFILRDIHAY